MGYNLLGITGTSTGLINGTNSDLVRTAAAPLNPMLGPLTTNGGPTLTMALIAGSPAIDDGHDSLTHSFATDETASISLLGDFNGKGIISQSEISAVYANYLSTSPWLYVTNGAGLGGTNVTFSVSNAVFGTFSVLYSPNLMNWYYLGPATPRYPLHRHERAVAAAILSPELSLSGRCVCG